jgi:hypothetical protein
MNIFTIILLLRIPQSEQVSISGRGKDFSFSYGIQANPGAHLVSYPNSNGEKVAQT